MSGFEKSQPLRAAVMSGVRWKVAGQIATQGSRIVVTLVLARLLLPRDFGLAGMVLVFAGIIQVTGDLGFSPGLIQYKVVSEADRSTAFWVNVFFGVALTGIGVASASFVAQFFGEPTLKPLFIVLSASFTIVALGSTQGALLTREMRFRELELAAGLGSVMGAVVAVVAAFQGAGPWALILQATVTSAATVVLLWIFAAWRPRLIVSRTSLRKLWGFGASVFGSRVLNYFSRNSDNALVGRFLGAHSLGVYSMAYAVIALPFDRVLAPVQSLLAPMFARLQDDRERTRDAWLRGMRMCVALIAPLTVGVVILATDFISVVLGSRWLPTVHVLQILAYVACLQSVMTITPLVLSSQFRTGLMLRLGTVSFAAHLLGFVVGLHWGVLGVATGFAISNTVVALPLQLVYPARLLEASARDVFRALAGVLQAAAGMALLVFVAQWLVDPLGGPALRLVVGVAVGAVSYPLLIAWREPRLVADLAPRSRLVSALQQPVVRRRRAGDPSGLTATVLLEHTVERGHELFAEPATLESGA